MIQVESISIDMLIEFFSMGKNVQDTVFVFNDDPEQEVHYIGVEHRFEPDKPYWAGYCDIKNGISFPTAEELFDAKIYDGKSIRERWDHIELWDIAGLSPEDWLELCWNKSRTWETLSRYSNST